MAGAAEQPLPHGVMTESVPDEVCADASPSPESKPGPSPSSATG